MQAITLFYWPTPNGQKVTILLEELGLPYEIRPVDILAGDQFKPEFLRISPNNKMPAMIDPDGPDGQPISLFESAVIMEYLAQKGGRFIPAGVRDLWRMREWLTFQMASVGPMLGQAHHFRQYAPEKIEYGIKRYTDEATRLYGVINRRLSESPYLAGDEMTLADLACYPWLVLWERQGQVLENFPHFARWLTELSERPAVQKGMEVAAEKRVDPATADADAWNTLFSNRRPD